MSTKKHWTVDWLPSKSLFAFWLGMNVACALVAYAPESVVGIHLWRRLLGSVVFFALFCLRSYGDNRSAR